MSTQQTGQVDQQETGIDRAAPDTEPKDWALFGSLLYGIATVGLFITFFTGLTIGDENSILLFSHEMLADEELFAAAAVAAEQMVFLSPLLAVAVGLYYHRDETSIEPAAKAAAVAAAAGVGVSLVLLTLLLVVFEPDLGEQATQTMGEQFSVDIGDEIPTIIGVAIGCAITAALTCFGFEKLDEHTNTESVADSQ